MKCEACQKETKNGNRHCNNRCGQKAWYMRQHGITYDNMRRVCPVCGVKYVAKQRKNKSCSKEQCRVIMRKGMAEYIPTNKDKEERELRELNGKIRRLKDARKMTSIYFVGRVCAE